MTALREAAQQALEALEYYRSGEDYQPTPASGAITALRAALAEPVQELVAWRWTESNGKHWFDWRTDWTHHDRAKELGFHVEYAYTAPPQHKPVETVNKTPAWWMDGLTATLMREGVNKHRAKEIAKGYWEAYCQVPMDEEQPK